MPSPRWLCLVAAAAAPAAVAAQGSPLRFDDPGWEMRGADTHVEPFLGQTALRLRSGEAIYRDVMLADGTIEFDVAVTPHRSFVYLKFRMQSDTEYEELYFRPHKSELPDAIQYSPVYRGVSNWQLYHGEGFTAATPLPPHRWLHVKVVLRGSRAAVFVEDMVQPKMIVQHLARDPRPGYVAVRSFLPANSAPDDVAVASFANVAVQPGLATFDFPEAPDRDPPPGLIREWSVSDVFPAGADPRQTLAAANEGRRWRRLTTDTDGLLVLRRYVDVPEGVRRPAILARVILRAERDGITPFQLGYSDDAIVSLNGTPLFYGDDAYRFNLPRRDGLIGLEQATVYLPLKRGENELVVAISDVFGGWGVMGRLDAEGPGVVVVAREDAR